MIEKRYESVFTLYPYRKVAAQARAEPERHPVVIVGGGPVGMTLALDLGRRGTPVLVLDDHDGVGVGSRAICFSRRTLDIADRLGCGHRMRDKGVVWNVGRIFHGDAEVFAFDLSPEGGWRNPAFVNLQQPYAEKYLVEAVDAARARGAPIEIRGVNRAVGLDVRDDHVRLDIDTPDGPYALEADRLVACDGARSPIRSMLGLDFAGRVFEDNFLIADVRMSAPFPSERWFWFEPPFEGAGQSALLHKQPDDVWRIDFQLGRDIDREAELEPGQVRTRIDAMLGPDVDYELVWTSVYTFQCRRMSAFRHGPVLFAGDSAHQVSPFGARGANSGIQDADNLGWKLDLVARGLAPDPLLDTYSAERSHAADENILASSRATDFLTPKSGTSATFRNAVLDLARHHAFARPLINSGRLSVPCSYADMPGGGPLDGPDGLGGPACARPGAPCPDAALDDGFLFEALDALGDGFALLCIDADAPERLEEGGVDACRLALPASAGAPPGARTGTLAERYLGDAPSAVYLVRPDRHVAARWTDFDEAAVRRVLRTATGREAARVAVTAERRATDATGATA